MRDAKAGLIERPITFGYDFRMRCDDCGQTSPLSGADYLRLDNEASARMECDLCKASIHFGPLAVGLRDQDDPALDDRMLNKLIWYLTSTYENWPSPDYERNVRDGFSTSPARSLMDDPERFLRVHLDKALHLGTFEAAIENMYRRMRDQGDEHSAFYLHRVRINIAPDRVNSGFHDENDERAADISITELTDLGLDAVRYLNVWEAAGCISLAVCPHVITAIQTIPVPGALSPDDDLPSEVLALIENLERKDKEPAAPEERQDLAYNLTQELEATLVAYFLPEVNPKVADDFTRAIGSAHAGGDSGHLAHACLFATHAGLLHAPERVLDLLDAAPSRRRD
ncbi:hypothetical protein [Streptomyces sp. NPDC047525]|uniref:hypothetical protein n=1 Tax=Streptomyces sp. NPDC047525 TaxID=3155264 RepID=UPI0033F8F922